MNQRSPLPATIRARVHAGAIDRVTRFYANSLPDTFAELLQNCRRSGATRVDVTTEELPNQGLRVTVADDGKGIADPAVLLSFGESGWDDATAHREDPAGMGIYALSRRGCTVASRTTDPDARGWTADLTPACFLGKDEAAVAEYDAPFDHGTAISFLADQSAATVQGALREAARHYPLPVACDGERLDQTPFLEGALHTETWNGLTFGVFKDRYAGFKNNDLNFHGLAIHAGLPSVAAVAGGTWCAIADVDACPGLELVLPARREAVQTPFLDEMLKAARIAIYRAMSLAERPPALAFADYTAAREAGIDIPAAPAMLRPWRPDVADSDDWRDSPPFASPDSGSLVMSAELDIQDSQALWRALERTAGASRLLEPDARLKGYGWYDALATLDSVRFFVSAGGVTHSLDALRAGTETPARAAAQALPPAMLSRPDTITVHLATGRNGKPGPAMTIPTDVAFLAEDYWCDLDATGPMVTADSAIQPHELAALLRYAFFSPSDDPDADSYDTQKTRFDDDAMHLALSLLASEEDARKHTIAEAVRREILWALPRDRDVSITLTGGRIAIEFAPEHRQAQGAPA